MIHAHYVLFVGRPGRSARLAEERLRDFVARVHGDDVDVEIVLVEREPLRAEQYGVLATPMIVRLLPLPSLRLIGVPNDLDQLAAAFDELPADEVSVAGWGGDDLAAPPDLADDRAKRA